MNKKVLIISGSPRRDGNSETLCKEFEKGAIESGNEVEIIAINSKKIGYCIACDGCQRNGGKCVIKDDMADILEKMIHADVIVMATPVYFYSLYGQMKVFIDRTYARFKEISNKDFYFIMTAAEGKNEMKRTLECFRGFTNCLEGAKEKGIVYGTDAWGKGEIESSPAMNQAYEYGENI